MEKEKFVFDILMSDYDAVMKILMKYVDRGKFLVDDVTSHILNKYWVMTFTIIGTRTCYELLCLELEKDWLLLRRHP
jgi:hypothetical protein